VPVDAMIIANHRAKNLGDLFSIRNIEKKTGPQSHPTFDRLGGFFATFFESQIVSASSLLSLFLLRARKEKKPSVSM